MELNGTDLESVSCLYSKYCDKMGSRLLYHIGGPGEKRQTNCWCPLHRICRVDLIEWDNWWNHSASSSLCCTGFMGTFDL